MNLPMDTLAPLLRQIPCADARTLAQAYHHVADANWVDGCTVDFSNLVLELRVSAPWRARSGVEAQLARVEQVARGHVR